MATGNVVGNSVEGKSAYPLCAYCKKVSCYKNSAGRVTKYCSKVCVSRSNYEKARHRVVKNKCERCQDSFQTTASNQSRKYCSRACADQSLIERGLVTKVARPPDKPATCKTCGKTKPPTEFYKYKTQRLKNEALTDECKKCLSKANAAYNKRRLSDPKKRAESLERRSSRSKDADRKAARRAYDQSPAGIASRERADEKRRLELANDPVRMKKHLARKEAARQNKLNKGRMTVWQAWNDWIHNIADDDWLDDYYANVHGKPWLDHRLSAAESCRVRRKHCPNYAIYQRMKSHLRRQKKDGKALALMRAALSRSGSSPTVEALFGYTIAELQAHLEKQFTKGMNWKRFNNSEIHIDHIIPKSSFDLDSESDLQACWALSNLRPLWAADNLKKSNKIEFLL